MSQPISTVIDFIFVASISVFMIGTIPDLIINYKKFKHLKIILQKLSIRFDSASIKLKLLSYFQLTHYLTGRYKGYEFYLEYLYPSYISFRLGEPENLLISVKLKNKSRLKLEVLNSNKIETTYLFLKQTKTECSKFDDRYSLLSNLPDKAKQCFKNKEFCDIFIRLFENGNRIITVDKKKIILNTIISEKELTQSYLKENLDNLIDLATMIEG